MAFNALSLGAIRVFVRATGEPALSVGLLKIKPLGASQAGRGIFVKAGLATAVTLFTGTVNRIEVPVRAILDAFAHAIEPIKNFIQEPGFPCAVFVQVAAKVAGKCICALLLQLAANEISRLIVTAAAGFRNIAPA